MTLMKSGKALASLTLLLTTAMAAPAFAADVKIAMNGIDDPTTNAEAAFVHGFANALKGTDFKAVIFPSDTLGSEKERFDETAQGLVEVDLATVSTGVGMSPLLKGILLPFLFKDSNEFDAVIEKSDLLDEMNKPLLENGVRLAGFNYIGVGIGIHNSQHDVTKMSDLKGLRLRALNAEQLEYEEALGASGTIVAWSEVANAIQVGIADGYLNPPNSSLRTGHTAFLTHFTPANISPSTRAVFVSNDWYETLSADEKTQIDKALDAGITANRAWLANWSDSVMARMEKAGVTISQLEPGERDKMVKATAPTWTSIMAVDDLQKYLDALKIVRN
ncbi:TRAP transporter substrate-binding protein [Thalassospira mesophila]|uniref:C4-dicarboxylate ABC transporter substrate-binding protein n=1 Tax=Thalassospira mesophila TaxID=1293891 RepID=A0A1Y2KYH3_9PROT|nr:TRAP transporter substrate-binding protein [Thalassospira mesophila]OSQ37389.1 C4-dicarboxylate ABC transporter substrate-binding protein [Thalassospira mesophila]